MPQRNDLMRRPTAPKPTAAQIGDFAGKAALGDPSASSRNITVKPPEKRGRKKGAEPISKVTYRVFDPADLAVLEALRDIQAIRSAIDPEAGGKADIVRAVRHFVVLGLMADGNPEFLSILEREAAKVGLPEAFRTSSSTS